MKLSNYKLAFFVCCCSFFPLFLTAQPPAFGWVRTAGSATSNVAIAEMVLDSTKAIVAVGLFRNTVDFDAGSGTSNLISNGNQDVFITKYTSNGNFVWAKSIGGTFDDNVMGFEKDRQGNLYLTGAYQGSTDFDPGPGVVNLPAPPFANSYILKLDKEGNFLWVKSIACIGNTLDIDDSGNILIGGDFGGTVDFDPGTAVFNMTNNLPLYRDMFVLKLTNDGNFLWAKQIRSLGAANYQQFGLETDASGNVFFAGNFTNSSDFDPGPAAVSLTSNGSDDAFILKLNAQGDYQWVKQFGSTLSDKAFALEVDKQGNVFTTGSFSGTVDFDPNAGSFALTSPSAQRCAFISKLDGGGNFIYAKNFQSGESAGQALSIDASNNLYISGLFYNTVDFDPGAGVYNLTGGMLFTAKLDANGGFLWAAGYPPTVAGLNFETVYSTILVDQLNSVYFAGQFSGTVDFDPGAAVFPVSTAGYGIWNMFLHKLGPSACSNSTSSVLNAQMCSSYLLNGISYTSAGQFYQQLTNAAGCDSILTLNLTIAAVQTNLQQTSCSPVLWKGQSLSSSGTYRDTVRFSNGCDSITVLSLTINTKPVPNLGRDTAICLTDTIPLSAGTFASYLWNNGSTAPSINASPPGIYWVDVTAANGCTARDSISITKSGNCNACNDPALVEKIYPTPFNGRLMVSIKSSDCDFKMDVYNVLGQLLLKSYRLRPGINTINLNNLPAAVYFYRIYNGNTVLSKGEIVKQ